MHSSDESGANVPAVEQRLNLFDRLNSFTKCNNNIAVSVKANMAMKGFFYEEANNVIKCSNCEDFVSTIDSIEYENHVCPSNDGADAAAATAATSSSASADNTSNANAPSLPGFIDDQKSKWPIYSDYDSRIATFKNWTNKNQYPEVLSAAGLFYIGIEDKTICFHCGRGLRKWTPLDEPWVEHARLQPKCNFVLKVRGAQFVSEAFKKNFTRPLEMNLNDARELMKELLEKLASWEDNPQE